LSRLTSAFRSLLLLDDTPHRIAAAFSIGVWIAFFPIWGIHTLMALGLAFALRMSRAAMVVGAWVNNPWTAPPLYAFGTAFGCWLLGVPLESFDGFDWTLHGREFIEDAVTSLRPFLMPFLLGNVLLGVVAGVVSYPVVRFLVERRRAARASSRPLAPSA
jgi:uncharacterized protein (DUF2062 family)